LILHDKADEGENPPEIGVIAPGKAILRVFWATVGRKPAPEPVKRPLLHCAKGTFG
jgi:hypothetical protein